MLSHLFNNIKIYQIYFSDVGYSLLLSRLDWICGFCYLFLENVNRRSWGVCQFSDTQNFKFYNMLISYIFVRLFQSANKSLHNTYSWDAL